uniref:SRCR domain-containing protein n=1 Tax=Ciona savignyi TaxID=51511 RepID=H2YM17_CIOSA
MTSGMLEVQSATDSYWYSVCFDGWSDANSFVACGELGFPSVNSHYSVPGFTAVVITCHGTESSLDGCTHVVTSSCQSGRVALSCSLRGIEVTRQIRLRAGAHTGDGRVQVALDSEWGSICAGNTWDLRGANVACRQLGYGTARHYFSGEQFGQGHGTIWLTNVECYGNETHIGQCGFERISRVHDYSNYSTDGCSQRQLAAI